MFTREDLNRCECEILITEHMHDNIREKDWKIFRNMAPELRERYLIARNEELAAILSDDQQTQTGRFWEVEERTRKIAKVLRECLDGHTRSKMELFMMIMIGHGMMTKDDLEKFSEELQDRFSPNFR